MTAAFRHLCRLSVIGLLVSIAVLSLRPSSGTATIPHADKVSHLLAYFALSLLVALGWPALRARLVWLWPFLFGVGIEIAQGLMGLGRSFSWLDMMANGIGAALATIIVFRLRARYAATTANPMTRG